MEDFVITNGILDTYNGNESHVVIPYGVKEIGAWAFAHCQSLTNIEIPNSVTKIRRCAFADCTGLTSIKIPSSVTSIGDGAFSKCTSLTSIKISNSVMNIGWWAFERMTQIKPQYNSNGSVRAFKAVKKDWTCRGFKYEMGKSYHQDGKIKCCKNGFHACTNPLDVFNYYQCILNNLRFAEVELSGKMSWNKDKVAASDIKIVRELTVSELAEIYNEMDKT